MSRNWSHRGFQPCFMEGENDVGLIGYLTQPSSLRTLRVGEERIPVATGVVDVSLGMGETGENIIIPLGTTSRNARDADLGIPSSAGVINKRLSIPSHKGLLGGGVQNSVNSSEPTLSIIHTNVKVPKELPVLRDLVDHIKANYPLDTLLESAYKYIKLIQEMLSKISKTCPSINSSGEQLVVVTPMNKVKRVRFTELVTSSRNTKTAHTSNLASNKPMLSSTGVKQSTSASGSQPSGNTKKDKIQQT
ncbi:hypothetical protein Tco_1145310 [Tanacetum coccineum]